MVSTVTNDSDLNDHSIEEIEFRVSDSNDVVVVDEDGDDRSFDVNGDGDGDLSVCGEVKSSIELDSVDIGGKVNSRVLDEKNGRSEEPVASSSDEVMMSLDTGVRFCEESDERGEEMGNVNFEVEGARKDAVEGVDFDTEDAKVEELDDGNEAVEHMEFEVKDGKDEQLDDESDRVENMESGTDGSDGTPIESVDGFDTWSDPFEFRDDPMESVSFSSRRGGGQAGLGSSAVSQYDSMLSKFDGYVANGGEPRGMQMTLDPGEMVWGKVKSHPWWPGQILSEALVSSSVRRLKREGHVLVAFFGDSSFRWFDPSELVPFDSNFEEKSRQTNMKNFVKAVEEALDEASRRYALGLVCKCRNRYNFRPADVEGNFVVDVGDYPGGVYSGILIVKARDSFQPAETLDFIRQLALTPRDNDARSIDMIKNTAKVFAYRKAVFEEFDETYSQAFGFPPDLPMPNDPSKLPMKKSPQVPLSGPLVIVEDLGGGKSSTKPKKVKDQFKKDKYLFKRRDVPNNSKGLYMNESHISSSGPLGYIEGTVSPDSIRPQVILKLEKGASGKQGVNIDAALDSNSYLEKEKDGSVQDVGIFQQEGNANEKTAQYHEGSHQPKANQEDAVQVDSKFLGTSTGCIVKKAKIPKRPIVDLGSDNSIQGEKKKRKKEIGSEALDNKQKRLATAKNMTSTGKFVGKSIMVDGVDSHEGLKRNGSINSAPGSMVDIQKIEHEMPQFLRALRVLALDPFHGAERNFHAVIPPIFLRFRSLVFRKSSSAQADSSQIITDQPSKKPPRPMGVKPDDPTKGGQKRAPSDRQEEKAAKKLKKIRDLKSLAAEKKAGFRNREAMRVEGKETMAAAAAAAPLPKASGLEPFKKEDPPARVVDPTMLVMKFPPQTNLPSNPELKARFTRFGPLDHEGTRVFWKSSTCRVVFRYKVDAQKAYKFAIGNNSLFGNVHVRYYLRDSSDDASGDNPVIVAPPPLNPIPLQPPPPVQLKSCLKKVSGDESGNNNGSGGGGRGTPRVKFMLGGEEEVMNNRKNYFNNADIGASNSSSSTTSTTFGMDFSSNNFQKVIPPVSSLPHTLPLPSHIAKPSQNMHFSEPPPPPPPVPIAPPQTQPRNITAATVTLSPPPPLPPTIDISQPMLNLLTRCNDVVSNVSSILGYLPYHPL